jgi:hypothetical protein
MAIYDEATRLLVTDLIRANEATGRRPALSSANCNRIRRVFSWILVNRWALEEHVRLLLTSSDRGLEQDVLADGPMEAALDRGLAGLDDDTLTRLILNPVALYGLADAIDERMPEAWLAEMEADGRSLIKADGRTLPSPHQALNRARAGSQAGMTGPGTKAKNRNDKSGA